MKIAILLAMLALPVALYMWARRRRALPTVNPRVAWEAVRSGAPMTRELAGAIGAYVAQNARRVSGTVDEVLSPDHYGVRLPDGSRVSASRSQTMWQHGVVLAPGHPVELLVVPGDSIGMIAKWR